MSEQNLLKSARDFQEDTFAGTAEAFFRSVREQNRSWLSNLVNPPGLGERVGVGQSGVRGLRAAGVKGNRMRKTSGPIKLVHIVTSPTTAWSFLRGQLRYMRERGMEVTVIASPGRGAG